MTFPANMFKPEVASVDPKLLGDGEHLPEAAQAAMYEAKRMYAATLLQLEQLKKTIMMLEYKVDTKDSASGSAVINLGAELKQIDEQLLASIAGVSMQVGGKALRGAALTSPNATDLASAIMLLNEVKTVLNSMNASI